MRLDVAAFCLAAHAHPGLDVDARCARLDELAQRCPTPTFDGMRAYLFETLGFRGNTRDYGDPENSFLDSVLERRLGIPISLAVVVMEVGRRIGAPVHGVGMPGHFLVMDAARDGVWCDPVPRRRALRPRRVPPAVRARARQRARLLRARCSRRPIRTRSSRACSPTSRAAGSPSDPMALGVDVRAAPRAARPARRPARADRDRAALGARPLELSATS